jgi:hypothetical protein
MTTEQLERLWQSADDPKAAEWQQAHERDPLLCLSWIVERGLLRPAPKAADR